MKKTILKNVIGLCFMLFAVFSFGIMSEASDLTEIYDYEVLEDGTAILTRCWKYESVITVPDTIEGYTVTALGDECFSGVNPTSISIPASVKSIGKGCFEYCNKLKTVKFMSDGLENIGEKAFAYCDLTNFKMPSTVKTIGDSAFLLTKVSNLTIPATVESLGIGIFKGAEIQTITFNCQYTQIPDRMFSSCKKLKTVVFPNGVKYIGKESFYECESLTDITIPEQVEIIDEKCFYNCKNLMTVTIPGSVKQIGNEAFKECANLKTVNFLTDGLQIIGEGTFFNSPVSTLRIPSTVTEIGDSAFRRTQISNVVIPGSLKKCGESVFESSSVESVKFEEGCQTVYKEMFSFCTDLKTVVLPKSLQYIRERAFSGAGNLDELILPAGLLKIEEYAFDGVKIKKFVVNCKNVSLDKSAFVRCYVEKLHCYYNSNVYKLFKKLKSEDDFGDYDDLEIIFIDNPLFFEKNKLTIGVGARKTLKPVGRGKKKWKSSNKKIATVDSKGVVTAKKNGTVKITVTMGDKKATCKVSIKENSVKFSSYSTKVFHYTPNKVLLGFKKMKRDSKGNYVLTGHIINTHPIAISYIKDLEVVVYSDGKLIAKQKYSKWNANTKARSSKAVTFIIKKKNIKKKYTDLRNEKIRVGFSKSYVY